MASTAVENAGARNELESVCDELLRQKLIEKKQNNNVAVIKILITKRSYKLKYVLEELKSSVQSITFCKNVFVQCGKAITVDSSSGRKNYSKRYLNESY